MEFNMTETMEDIPQNAAEVLKNYTGDFEQVVADLLATTEGRENSGMVLKAANALRLNNQLEQ